MPPARPSAQTGKSSARYLRRLASSARVQRTNSALNSAASFNAGQVQVDLDGAEGSSSSAGNLDPPVRLVSHPAGFRPAALSSLPELEGADDEGGDTNRGRDLP